MYIPYLIFVPLLDCSYFRIFEVILPPLKCLALPCSELSIYIYNVLLFVNGSGSCICTSICALNSVVGVQQISFALQI